MFLYLDNYRGFANTMLEFGDVTFLVGENSTGKSSVLEAINALMSPHFLLASRFEGDSFSSFQDIVSKNSKDRTYFFVGGISDDNQQRLSAVLVKYVSKRGSPVPDTVCYYHNGIEVVVRDAQNTSPKVRIRKLKEYSFAKHFASRVFKRNWVKDDHQETTQSPFRQIKLDGALSPVHLANIMATSVSLRDGEETDTEDVMSFTETLTRISPIFPGNSAWIAPIRSRPRRTYDDFTMEYSAEGEHTPYLLKNSLNRRAFRSQIKMFGKDSGLYEDLSIHEYGESETAPFEVDVRINGHSLNINSVGYGVSQSLPVVTEIMSRGRNPFFLIQQPEIHLHPRAQAAMGGLFFKKAMQDNMRFVVETHSDYVIDRFRLGFRKKNKNKPTGCNVYFFSRSRAGNRAHKIPISSKGELSDKQPKRYREFFLKEELRILGLD